MGPLRGSRNESFRIFFFSSKDFLIRAFIPICLSAICSLGRGRFVASLGNQWPSFERSQVRFKSSLNFERDFDTHFRANNLIIYVTLLQMGQPIFRIFNFSCRIRTGFELGSLEWKARTLTTKPPPRPNKLFTRSKYVENLSFSASPSNYQLINLTS